MQKTSPYRRDSHAGLLGEAGFFVTIDFDGTITDTDITDAVIKEFAMPGWEAAEKLWEEGMIGSQECLSVQMSLIDPPLDRLLDYTGRFAINNGFPAFVDFLRAFEIPFAIVSDGFGIFIERLLAGAGIRGIPVYASRLREEKGKLKASFPYAGSECTGATCKCRLSRELSGGLPVIHIGDGRSDFCLAGKAAYVFSRGKLAGHCAAAGIPHSPFDTFASIETGLKVLLSHLAMPGNVKRPGHYGERIRESWNPA